MSTPVPPHDEPLAVEDFRSLRRWLVILGAIAAVATAIAIYALVQATESENEKADRDRVVVLERQLRSRLAEVDRRLGKASEESDVRRLQRRGAEEADVNKLDRRLRRVENDVTDAVDTAADSGQALVRIDRRLDILARRVAALRRR